MVVVRPGTIGPAPVRAETEWKAADDRFFASRCKAGSGSPARPVAWGGQGGGKKLATGVAGRRARRSRSSVRPNPFEDAVGVADREIRGTRHWWRSASALARQRRWISARVNLTPDLRRQGLHILHGQTWRLPIFTFFAAPWLAGRRRSPMAQRARSHQRRSKSPLVIRPKMSMPRTEITGSWSCRRCCARMSPCLRSPERGFISGRATKRRSSR